VVRLNEKVTKPYCKSSNARDKILFATKLSRLCAVSKELSISTTYFADSKSISDERILEVVFKSYDELITKLLELRSSNTLVHEFYLMVHDLATNAVLVIYDTQVTTHNIINDARALFYAGFLLSLDVGFIVEAFMTLQWFMMKFYPHVWCKFCTVEILIKEEGKFLDIGDVPSLLKLRSTLTNYLYIRDCYEVLISDIVACLPVTLSPFWEPRASARVHCFWLC
jgi:hypothetical protein